MVDYYEVLGINKDATQEQIKSAYKTLAKKYHPDVNDAPNATAFFRLIQEAYETLREPSKREQYDSSHSSDQVSQEYEEREDYSENNRNYSQCTYEYRVEEVPVKPERRKDIPIVETLLAITAVACLINAITHIHPVFLHFNWLSFRCCPNSFISNPCRLVDNLINL